MNNDIEFFKNNEQEQLSNIEKNNNTSSSNNQYKFDFNKEDGYVNKISKIINSRYNITNALTEFVNRQQEYINKVLDTSTKIFEGISKFYSFTETLSKAFQPIGYYGLLSRLNWPLFLISNEELQTEILEVCKTNEDSEKVYEIVDRYFTEEYLEELENDWLSCEVLSETRKPILQEAIKMHKLGYYFSSVSILMCQLYGISGDIEVLKKSKNLTLEKEGKEFLAEHFKLDINYIDNEKGKLFQSVMFTENGMFVWNEIVKYLKNVTFMSKPDFSELGNQPLRNKIAHGEQMNFGTKEHSIKAILIADILIQLLYHLSCVEPADK